MRNPPGSFIWYELLSTDPDAATAFYGAVVGWSVHSPSQPGLDYRLFRAGATDVAGCMQLPPATAASGVPSVWLGYIGVEDVDATVASIVAKGGAVHMPATDLPGVGRFAMVADPEGASFYVMRGESHEASSSFAADTPGHGGWHELHAKNSEAALAFYAGQFGWKQVEALDMGPVGLYRLFGLNTSDAIGGMMDNPHIPRPAWLYYFNVEDIDAAQHRLTQHGGKVVEGPTQVPGGSFVLQATDPQGAMFALAGPRKA